MVTDRPTPAWKKKIGNEIGTYIRRGDYRAALPVAKAARIRFPKDAFCQFQYAKILGDWADELPPAQKRKLKREAVAILRPLTRALRGEDAKTRFGICLNYYYQSENFGGMVRFGKKLAARGDRQGHYAVGLGSSLEAMRRFENNSHGRGLNPAKASLKAWKIYGLSKEKYYFPHYIEAMAHAVLGNTRLGLESLTRAAKVSRRKITDWEFADVLALLRPGLEKNRK